MLACNLWERGLPAMQTIRFVSYTVSPFIASKLTPRGEYQYL
ncbi:hypothetical protein ALP94_03344 [Pseudomonas savastanoi pv. glycinea]|nr:hypothetical protein ALP94_03344 [Pseudomonas savastanoi pv. glycinea]